MENLVSIAAPWTFIYQLKNFSIFSEGFGAHAVEVILCVFSSVEQVEQMNSLLHQKQKELVVAVSKVEELSKQLETLKNGQLDALHSNQSSVADLDRLYRELQVQAEVQS